MRLLLDQGLPRSAASILADAGIDTLHVGEIGYSSAENADICCYTTALLLQEIHRERLKTLVDRLDMLPDLFTGELEVPGRTDPSDALRILAMRQRDLTGRSINWLGTYEHGADQLLQVLERRKQWKV